MPKPASTRVPTRPPTSIKGDSITIGGLARAAEVGVETIRYYQRRSLLPVPHSGGGVRRYPVAMIDRIRFIKRSQTLGFTLDEIRELLRLEQGGSRGAIQRIAGVRLSSIRQKIAMLRSMETLLAKLLCQCEHTATATPCPIIAALSADRVAGNA